MGSLLCVHCYLMPFKRTANNHLETFVLLCGFFIASLNITDDPSAFFPYVITALSIAPLLPLLPLFYDFIKLKRKQDTDKIATFVLELIFSTEIPANTFIDSAYITYHLHDYLKIIGCNVDVNRVHGKQRRFFIDFQCEWINFDKLPQELLINPQIAMDTSVMHILEDNEPLTKKLVQAFKVSKSTPMDISKMILTGSIDNTAKNKFFIEQLLKVQQIRKMQIEKEFVENTIDMKPLHRFSALDICQKIEWWLLNDIQYEQNLIDIMYIFAQHSLSGKKFYSLGNDLKTVLRSKISPFMTNETFDIIISYMDGLRDNNKEFIIKQSAPQIALLVCNYPLNAFMEVIKNRMITGEVFLESYYDITVCDLMKDVTGWDDKEIYQIEHTLLQHNTPKLAEIEQRIIESLDNTYLRKMGHGFIAQLNEHNVDLEQLHLKMTNCYNINIESQIIVDIIYDLQQEYNYDTTIYQDGRTNTVQEEEKYICNDDFVPIFYKAIASAFTVNVYSEVIDTETVTTPIPLSVFDRYYDKKNNWKCSNCGNDNYGNYISGKMNNKTEICNLCGIKEIDSVIIQLKGNETYITVNDEDDKYCPEIKIDDQIDAEIFDIINENKLDLSCPKELDSKIKCKSMLRLAKTLKIYQNWVNKIKQKTNKSDIDTTTNVKILQLSNDEFHNIFIELASNIKQINEEQIEIIKQMLNNDIINIEFFCQSERRQFCYKIVQRTKVKMGYVASLYKKIRNRLFVAAQTKQFGQFFIDSNASIIDMDYHHILRYHISDQFGNVNTKENVFKYFSDVLECDLEDCQSNVRYSERELQFKQTQQYYTDKSNKMNDAAIDDRIWHLKQRYVQTTLDLVHVYFVHHGIDETHESGDDDKSDNEEVKLNKNTSIEMVPLLQNIKSAKISTTALQNIKSAKISNKDKYVTDASNITEYGFGIDHNYPHLTPIFSCVKEELTKNTQHKIPNYLFQDLLMKAVKLHNIAKYAHELKCTQYKEEYNIVRNAFIGIRHILAMITYTDMSAFCTKFRETYRKLNNKETDYDVQQRHCQFYYFSKSLFEAIEFFGTEMDANMAVYHGLSKVMNFERFTAYFNQPISTTLSVITALQFTQGDGIYLTFKRGSSKQSDALIPKFFDVTWMSQYPNEEERLFYGENIVFEIFDIYEAKARLSHKTELKMLNLFQRCVRNKQVKWKSTVKEKKMIQDLTYLIDKCQYDEEKEEKKDEEQKPHYVTEYGMDLFCYFCQNVSTKWICIKQYHQFPILLKKHLLYNETNKLSFIKLSTLFPFVETIVLNELTTKQITEESIDYINAIKEYIKYVKSNNKQHNLREIIFETKPETDGKPNSILKKLANKCHDQLDGQWNIAYNFKLESTHTLAISYTASTAQTIQKRILGVM